LLVDNEFFEKGEKMSFGVVGNEKVSFCQFVVPKTNGRKTILDLEYFFNGKKISPSIYGYDLFRVEEIDKMPATMVLDNSLEKIKQLTLPLINNGGCFQSIQHTFSCFECQLVIKASGPLKRLFFPIKVQKTVILYVDKNSEGQFWIEKCVEIKSWLNEGFEGSCGIVFVGNFP
jgi:hypothetical protein